tara:strand:+ start:75 stop:329 length:255 start_codon:yes stop_codon:yes gene_type:complete
MLTLTKADRIEIAAKKAAMGEFDGPGSEIDRLEKTKLGSFRRIGVTRAPTNSRKGKREGSGTRVHYTKGGGVWSKPLRVKLKLQ